jgi:uncharacterized protein (TIGR02466 family)
MSLQVHQPDGGLYTFPPLIWKYNYTFNLGELRPKLDELFAKVEINSALEKGDAISTVAVDSTYQPHTWMELEKFQMWLGSKIADIRRCYKFVHNYSEVSNSWCNRHYYGGYTDEHTHTFGTFVVSCYLKAPENSGNIEFKDPLEYHKSAFPIIPETSLYSEVPVTTNDVLIFPGWLKHRVQPNLTNEERIVLTFNIK